MSLLASDPFGFTFPDKLDSTLSTGISPFFLNDAAVDTQFDFDFSDVNTFLDDSFGSSAFDSDFLGGSSSEHRDSIDYTSSADLSPVATISTPTSIALVSPKSSFSIPPSVVDVGTLSSLPAPVISGVDTAEALSNHHLQRYLHYKALAAQAEADARAATISSASTTCTGTEDFDVDAILAACSSMPTSQVPTPKGDFESNMLQFQPQPTQPTYNMGQPGMDMFSYQPQATASMAHAQAQAHLQAHDAANRFTHRASGNYYLQPSATRSSFEPPQQMMPAALPIQPPNQLWGRHSQASSIASPPVPSTPVYYAPIPVPFSKSASVPSFSTVTSPSVPVQGPASLHSEGENEIDMDDSEEASQSGDIDIKPSIDGMPLTNLHGGGRGYVPGKTPDDPKKRHKCQVCGRGFARAFNLKSHIQTHNPLRSKPHQCPHASCKRGFSRLHDLERHRQGIHGDGPLMDAKRTGLAPAVARAQGRLQKRAESGGLI